VRGAVIEEEEEDLVLDVTAYKLITADPAIEEEESLDE